MDSSKVYKRTKEGKASWIRISPGTKVQIHSNKCPSTNPLWTTELVNIFLKRVATNTKMNKRIRLAKSWKYMNSSIGDEIASCKFNWDQVDNEWQFKFTKFKVYLTYTTLFK